MTLEQIPRLLAKVFPKRSVKNLQVLSGGLINTNIRVDFEANYEPVVIRLDNWREIARVIDLSGLVECLTHDELPIDVEIELLELINATLDHRDPILNK